MQVGRLQSTWWSEQPNLHIKVMPFKFIFVLLLQSSKESVKWSLIVKVTTAPGRGWTHTLTFTLILLYIWSLAREKRNSPFLKQVPIGWARSCPQSPSPMAASHPYFFFDWQPLCCQRFLLLLLKSCACRSTKAWWRLHNTSLPLPIGFSDILHMYASTIKCVVPQCEKMLTIQTSNKKSKLQWSKA